MELVPYDDVRNIHEGATMVVAGTGPSLQESLEYMDRWPTIGINRAAAFFDCSYLLFWDAYLHMPDAHKKAIGAYRGHVFHPARHHRTFQPGCRPKELQWSKHTPYTEQRKKAGSNADWEGIHRDVYTSRHTTFIGISVAMWMGAKRIGIIGMDITEDSGVSQWLKLIDSDLVFIYRNCAKIGIEVVNLSPISNCMGLPLMSLENFK